MNRNKNCLFLWKFCLGWVLFFLTPNLLNAQSHPFTTLRHHPQGQVQLQAIVQAAIANVFGNSIPLPKNLLPEFQKPLAVFVTVKKDDRIRGCIGTLQAKQARLADEIFFNLERAFRQDPRHRPIQAGEVPGMEIFITAVGTPEKIPNPNLINPARDAIVVRYGNKAGVVLAGEAKTRRYQLALAKAKAGIQAHEPYQVAGLPTQTLSVKILGINQQPILQKF